MATALGLLMAAALYVSLSLAVSAFGGQRSFRVPRNWRAWVSPDAYWRWEEN